MQYLKCYLISRPSAAYNSCIMFRQKLDKKWNKLDSGTNSGTGVLLALRQHVHVELTLANVASITADALHPPNNKNKNISVIHLWMNSIKKFHSHSLRILTNNRTKESKRKRLKTYILESLSMNVTGAREHAASDRGNRCRGSLNSFMLNGTWAHDRINSPMCNCASGSKSHTYRKFPKNTKQRG